MNIGWILVMVGIVPLLCGIAIRDVLWIFIGLVFFLIGIVTHLIKQRSRKQTKAHL